MLMQTEVKAVAESIPAGSPVSGRMRKSGTTSLNHGVVERSSLNHWPVVPWASLSRFRMMVSIDCQSLPKSKRFRFIRKLGA